MSAFFYRKPIEEHQATFEIGGVSFNDKVAEYLGALAEAGAEVWTAWADVDPDASGDAYTTQITPDICTTILSIIDDPADAILLKDERDGQHFVFQRYDHEEIFDWVYETVQPWAKNVISLTPDEDMYNRMISKMMGDIAEIDLIGLPPEVDGL